MGGEGRRGSVDELIDELRAVREDRTRVIAIVWTWLERHLAEYGRLGCKDSEIRKAASESKRSTAIDAKRLRRLRKAPLLEAAMLLAELNAELERNSGTSLVEVTRGVDGEEVYVVWRELTVAALTQPDDLLPPAADEHPSLAALAPRIVVCPVVHAGIELEILRPEEEQDPAVAEEWRYAQSLLGDWLVGKPSLDIHLDTLGEHGLSGWKPDDDRPAVVFRDDEIEKADEDGCVDAARRAVCKVAERVRASAERPKGAVPLPAVLLMPELAATDRVRRAIADEIRRQDYPPALTVFGLYHQPAGSSDVDPELVGDAQLAGWVNEAVVLGPTGVELWRHRKLSAAEAELPVRDEEGVVRKRDLVEDIQPGARIRMVQTPIGTIAVVICLDSFRKQVCARLLASPADFLLVPSLSPSAHRHKNSLQELVQKLWGVGFVCNRTLPPEKAGKEKAAKGDGPAKTVWNEDSHRSFWVLQRAALEVPPPRPPGAHPSFVFELGSYFAGRKSSCKDPEEEN